MTRTTSVSALLAASTLVFVASSHAAEPLVLGRGEHISYIGNTTADRMQHHGWLETLIQALHPEQNLSFRNLGFPGDELTNRNRSQNFGSPDQWLAKVKSDVVFCFFGYNEAFRGPDGLESFKANLAKMIDDMRAHQYNGKSSPRLVFFSPIAHENHHSPHLPDGKANNVNLALYTKAMKEVCQAKKARFVDLFHPTSELYRQAESRLTMNGVHLLEHGNAAVARTIINDLFPEAVNRLDRSASELENLREAVLDKNLHWFSRYRVVDGFNVFGGRSTLAWFGQSNADVMMREMEVFDVMTANRDKRVWAVAQGRELKVDDGNAPKTLVVKSNKPGVLEGGKHPYFGGQEAIAKMQVAEGMQVNLFASEEMFPEMVNPVQMAVDTDGRLFASVWPSYPHWNPTQPRTDRIVCLPDDNGDGVADKCVVFADKLNSITGFEFWGGGILVAAPPEIWFIKDTDGDDVADVKIRMMQGVSSADSHHTANAVVVGPDGWMYWSRGIFNTASIETPTKTYRSARSGVHRFNPRTFEMEFHFPIGPNPHGDVFDQWGYQFANDGTGGTGSYVNIGKGVGNKQWFRKRVRPVSATGILSSSHFPEENNGNFLICNCIGVLGVLQHKVSYDGADITAQEIEPILLSSDPNFRPTDVEVGGDGALYVSDWCNVLIGHMQHNIRDPNRDHQHGRIYRVTHKKRPLLKPVKLKGKPIEEVLQAFYAAENSTRYRARLELSGRDSAAVAKAVNDWTNSLDISKPEQAQAMLECLWVHEEHRIPNGRLLKKVFQAEEPRVRAAAIRTLGHWVEGVADWPQLLLDAARDDSALVRAEAVKSAVSFPGLTAAEVIFEASTRPTDSELDAVLKYAKGRIDVDKVVQEAVSSGRELSTAAQQYVLRNASVNDLLKLERTEAVYLAILSRPKVPAAPLRESLTGLAKIRKERPIELILDLVEERVATKKPEGLSGLAKLLTEQSPTDLKGSGLRIEKLAKQGATAELRQIAYAAWITSEGSGDGAFVYAARSKDSLRDVLLAVPSVERKLRGELYKHIQPLLFELPTNLKSEAGRGSYRPGIKVDYFYPSAKDVARETLAKMTPKASGIVPEIVMNVPQKKQSDAFALRFTGTLQAPKSGAYEFSCASDDGSRLYLDGKLVVNNDGLHGMVERSAKVNLNAGPHAILVTYFDNGGGDGLKVSWSGPGIRKQTIPANRLMVGGAETLHDVAIQSLASVPGHDEAKVRDLTTLVKAGRQRSSAIHALKKIDIKHWSKHELQPVADNLIGYLSEIPAQYRNGGPALDAIALAKSIAGRVPPPQAKAIQDRLKNLDVRVIAIGTVPHRMIFDKERIAVQAGKAVEFRFSNTDNMPHNFAITLPGALEEVGALAEATARTPDAMARQYIPESDKIIAASRLLQGGETESLTFEAPSAPGVYPYVCTYPGHWRRMYGALYVVANLEGYLANPVAYLAANPLPLRDELLKFNARNTEWKFDTLASSIKPLAEGRNFDVGKNIFKVGNCVACHKINDEGQAIGPDLTKLEEKKATPEHILLSLLEPSKDIDEKFQSHSFLLDSGKQITGMIVEDAPTQIKVMIDPLGKAEPVTIAKDAIEEQKKSTVSIMPEGLANRLSREEILDLIAYIYAKGDMKHKVFEDHEHKH